MGDLGRDRGGRQSKGRDKTGELDLFGKERAVKVFSRLSYVPPLRGSVFSLNA